MLFDAMTRQGVHMVDPNDPSRTWKAQNKFTPWAVLEISGPPVTTGWPQKDRQQPSITECCKVVLELKTTTVLHIYYIYSNKKY